MSKEIDTIDRVGRKITDFKPTIPADQADAVRDFVQTVVSKAAPATKYAANDLLSIMFRFAAWCWINGISLDETVVFDQYTIERFILTASDEWSDGTRANRRSMLYRIATAVCGPGVVPERLTPLAASDPIAPYEPREMLAYGPWIDSRRTAAQRHNLYALVALSAGAGLATEDLLPITAGDISTDEHGTLVTVTGRRARIVPALARWEQTLAELAANLEPDQFLFRPERTKVHPKNAVSNYAAKQDYTGVPILSAQRLRATWIVHHLSSRTPLAALVPAAGVQTLHALARYLKFVPDMDDSERRIYLRGTP